MSPKTFILKQYKVKHDKDNDKEKTPVKLRLTVKELRTRQLGRKTPRCLPSLRFVP